MQYWLNRLGVQEYENRKLETLSKGNQQKVQLAQTLVCDPQIIILDEPFSGLDPVNSQILKDVISEQISKGKLVIFSSHQMNYVEEFCEDIVIINHGNIVLNGNLREIKKEFGKDRLVLSLAGEEAKETVRFVREQFGQIVEVCGTQKEKVILKLRENQTKQTLLRMLAETIFLWKAQVMRHETVFYCTEI